MIRDVTEKTGARYSEEEAAKRMDAALRRALITPPKPHKDIIGKKGKSPKGKAKKS